MLIGIVPMNSIEKIVECLESYRGGVRVIKYEFDVRILSAISPTIDTKFIFKTRVIIPNENRRKKDASIV